MKQAEKDGKQAEAGNTLENYDSEMNSAAQKSQEAKEASKKEESGDFGDGTSGESFSDGEVKPQVVNPVPVIQRIRRMGLLDLVVPASKGISDQKSHMEICYQEEHFNREWRCRRKREKIIPDQQKYCFSSI